MVEDRVVVLDNSELLAYALLSRIEGGLTIGEDLAGPKARLTLVNYFPAKMEGVRVTP